MEFSKQIPHVDKESLLMSFEQLHGIEVESTDRDSINLRINEIESYHEEDEQIIITETGNEVAGTWVSREQVKKLRNIFTEWLAQHDILSDDQVFQHLVEIADTGSYKIEGDSLYTRREENSDWFFCGEIVNREQVEQQWDSIVATL